VEKVTGGAPQPWTSIPRGGVVVVVVEGTVGGAVEEVDTVPVCVEHAAAVAKTRISMRRIEDHYAVAIRLASVLCEFAFT
jgi:hypothetical protein